MVINQAHKTSSSPSCEWHLNQFLLRLNQVRLCQQQQQLLPISPPSIISSSNLFVTALFLTFSTLIPSGVVLHYLHNNKQQEQGHCASSIIIGQQQVQQQHQHKSRPTVSPIQSRESVKQIGIILSQSSRVRCFFFFASFLQNINHGAIELGLKSKKYMDQTLHK